MGGNGIEKDILAHLYTTASQERALRLDASWVCRCMTRLVRHWWSSQCTTIQFKPAPADGYCPRRPVSVHQSRPGTNQSDFVLSPTTVYIVRWYCRLRYTKDADRTLRLELYPHRPHVPENHIHSTATFTVVYITLLAGISVLFSCDCDFLPYFIDSFLFATTAPFQLYDWHYPILPPAAWQCFQ